MLTHSWNSNDRKSESLQIWRKKKRGWNYTSSTISGNSKERFSKGSSVVKLFHSDRGRVRIELRSPVLRAGSLPAEPQGNPRIQEWVAYPFSSGSSRPRNQAGVSCIAGGLFTHWAIREAQVLPLVRVFTLVFYFPWKIMIPSDHVAQLNYNFFIDVQALKSLIFHNPSFICSILKQVLKILSLN